MVKGCFDVTTQRRIFFSRRCWVVIFSFVVSSLPRRLFSNGTWYQPSRRHRHSRCVHNPPFPSSFHNPLTPLDRCDLKIRPYPLGSQCRPSDLLVCSAMV